MAQLKLSRPDLTTPYDQGPGASIQMSTANDTCQHRDEIASISLSIMEDILLTVCQGTDSQYPIESTSIHSHINISSSSDYFSIIMKNS